MNMAVIDKLSNPELRVPDAAELRQQAVSFAYANAKIENNAITRKMVDESVDEAVRLFESIRIRSNA